MVITLWLLKTAMTFDLLGEKKRPCYFDPSERHALYRFLEAPPIPPSTQVFLARYKGSKDSVIRETHLELARWTGDPNPDSLSRLRGYAVTIAVKELVLQIFCARGLPDRVAYYMPDFDSAVSQIGLGNGDVSWPLSSRFDDAGLNIFTERWLNLAPPPS
jgi:hypothetical protein